MTAEVLQWQFESGFPYSGIDDPFLEDHIASIEPRTEAFIEHYRALFDKGFTAPSFLNFIIALETTYHLDYYPVSYLELQAAKNTTVTETASDVWIRMGSAYRKRDSLFSEFLLQMTDDVRESIFQSNELAPYKRVLVQQYQDAMLHTASNEPKLSQIDIHKTKLRDEYMSLRDHMKIILADGEQLDSTSAYDRILNSTQRSQKRHIWEKIAAMYKENAKDAARVLNGLIKLNIQQETIASETTLAKQLRSSGFDEHMLHAMRTAAKDYLPDSKAIREQYALHHGLPSMERWDMYAPRQSERSYSLDLTIRAVQSSWERIHPNLGALIQKMIQEGWIDTQYGSNASFLQGSYGSPVHDWPRINFSGTISSVSTVFHETGHAVYDYLAKRNSVYAGAVQYNSLAEMIALFSEKFGVSHIQSRNQAVDITDPKSVLGQNYTMPVTAMIWHEFETVVYQRIRQGEQLSEDDFALIYKQSVENWGIQVSEGEQWEWVGITHYFVYPFYCWNYAVGELLANVLITLSIEYEKHDNTHEFGQKLAMFMAEGSSKDPRELFLKYFDLDMHDDDFWQRGFRKAHEYAEYLRTTAHNTY